ncbi:MAG TPA: M23 family metallopeptidase [Candidatus Marinimicrobia bacterium]|nr:M23 family metallopeptidase [Candidatus Neomarinimicrobiota bacterium]
MAAKDNSKKYTIYLIPSDEGKQREFTVRKRSLIILLLVLAALFVGLIVSVALMAPRAVQSGVLSGELDRLSSDRAQMVQLLEDYRKMKAMNQYIRKLLGLHLVKWEDDSATISLPDSLFDFSFSPESHIVVLDNIPNSIPAYGIISQPFNDSSPFYQDNHYGIDIAMRVGSSIHAAASGLVVFSGWTDHFGNMLIIDHRSGYYSVYAHNSRNVVSQRQWVNRRQLIALSGNSGYSTGPHLHFEIWKDGVALDPSIFISEYIFR